VKALVMVAHAAIVLLLSWVFFVLLFSLTEV